MTGSEARPHGDPRRRGGDGGADGGAMASLLRQVPTVELAAWLRVLRRTPSDSAARGIAAQIEIELRVRALLARTPGIGAPHGAAAATAPLDDASR